MPTKSIEMTRNICHVVMNNHLMFFLNVHVHTAVMVNHKWFPCPLDALFQPQNRLWTHTTPQYCTFHFCCSNKWPIILISIHWVPDHDLLTICVASRPWSLPLLSGTVMTNLIFSTFSGHMGYEDCLQCIFVWLGHIIQDYREPIKVCCIPLAIFQPN